FADLESKIQARMVEVTLFELLNDAKCMQIVVEPAAMLAHSLVELLFTGMTEGRMPDIADQGQRLREIRIEPQRTGNCASDLRNFQRVREAIAKMMGEAGGENLRLRL